MKVFTQYIDARPHIAKFFEWGKMASVIGSAQVAVQAFGFIAGVFVIRVLPTNEYALYTLANTLLANLIILADSGIADGVIAQGGKVWQDRDKLGAVITTGLALRKKMALASLLIALPGLLLLLRHHGASWLMALLIIVSIIPAFLAAISGSLFEVAPRLWQQVAPVQRVQVWAALGRLTLLGISLLVMPWTFIACLASGIPQIWATRQFKGISLKFAAENQKPDLEVRKAILAMVKRLLPDALYICLAGQITIWLISIFGSTAALAQAGALSRLAMILNLVLALFGSMIMPRFARIPNHSPILFKRYVQIELSFVLICICIVLGTWLFATQALWILGHSYAGLHRELVLMMMGSCIYLMAQMSFSLCVSKGWVINPLITIPVSITSIAIGALVIDVSSLKGVFLHSMFVSTVQLVMHIIYGLYRFRLLARQTSTDDIITA